MPQSNIETMALADRYAAALLSAAAELNCKEQVAEELTGLVAYVAEDSRFEQFLTSPSLDGEPRRKSLETLFRGKLHDLVLNMLLVLNERRRSGLLRSVQRCVQLRMEFEHAEREVQIETAQPLQDRSREAIRRVVSGWLGQTAILIEEVKPELIGGMVIQVADIRVDASVRSRVEAIRQRLGQRISKEIHSGQLYHAESDRE